MKSWNRRDEYYKAFHNWPVMLVYCGLGLLLGWGISYLWPAPYQSTVQVYVALNPYRTYSDAQFLALARPKYSNLDDYKNWQMSQLESAVFLDETIQATLAALRQYDLAWEKVSESDFRLMLEADWRSAGIWSLSATHSNKEAAQQAAQTWSETAVSLVKSAVTSAENSFMIDQQLLAVAEEQSQAKLRAQELAALKESLAEWSDYATNLPQDQPIEAAQAWQLLAMVARLAEFDPAWTTVLDRQPPATAVPSEYLQWLGNIRVLIDLEQDSLQSQTAYLEAEHASLAVNYRLENKKSLGLSPNLAVEKIETLPVEAVRSPAMVALVGGGVGLLGWFFLRIMIASRLTEGR